ncbi:MAG TPA: cytochrome c oxidase subunit II [Thermoleophilia bacterium]|nr:cytochrome c oxidase subunit II [Thermoleophilia bacterium]
MRGSESHQHGHTARRRAIVVAYVAVVVAAATVVLVGCASPSILRPAGSAAEDIRTLALWVFGILMGVLITVWAILVYVIVTGRRRPESEASQTKGNLRIEIVWTAIPAVIVSVLFVLTLITTERIVSVDPVGTQFTAIGRQWWWDFRFPSLGFNSPNEVYVIQGRPTSIEVLSADVIHSFWVPQMGGKVQMIPSHVNHIAFVPLAAGTYLGECSEFCGAQHGNMRFQFVVVSAGKYSAWVRLQQQPAAEPTGAAAVAGKQVISSVGCGSCHTIRGTTLHGTFGPDLTHFGGRGGIGAYTLTNTPANLLRWIQDPQAVKPQCKMPQIPLPLAQQQQLVAYLEELK